MKQKNYNITLGLGRRLDNYTRAYAIKAAGEDQAIRKATVKFRDEIEAEIGRDVLSWGKIFTIQVVQIGN